VYNLNKALVLENSVLPVVIQDLPYTQLVFCSQKLEPSQMVKAAVLATINVKQRQECHC